MRFLIIIVTLLGASCNALGQTSNLNLILSQSDMRAILANASPSEEMREIQGELVKKELRVLLTSFCYSDHRGDSPRLSLYNEVNKCAGIAYYTSFKPLGCRTFGEAGYIQKNSLEGESYTFGVGVECEIAKQHFTNAPPLSFGVGVKHLHLKYKDPGIITKREAEWSGRVTFPTAYIAFGDWRVSASALGKNIGLYNISYEIRF